ncbi:BQ5605_C023g09654 [Microbotryum silenes-dioicae]|uniref:DNA polymerase epsilon subunit B n=1 Tax=Microbotryum silenes-dioicae TaxID=796604 RepID=A0A2X0PEZ6_9BASI|nr:BQ5605_C023g09654 [Microbotryum silenes-dioicae]
MFTNQRQPAQPSSTTAADLARKVFLIKYNLQLAVGAIEWLQAFLDECEIDDEPTILDVYERLVAGMQGGGNGLDGPSKVTPSLLEATREKLSVQADQPVHEHGHHLESSHYLKIVDAFEMPAWRWGEERKGFEKSENLPSLTPGPKAKAQYLRDRFNIIKQTILRNDHFSPPAIAGIQRAEYNQLTSIKNLLGRQGGHFLIFGLLTRMEDGAFYLEDLDDKVELDLSEATPETGLFTEGSFVLLDGDYTLQSTFKVSEMGHPPCERREEAMKLYGHHDFLGLGAISKEEEADFVKSERSPQHETSFIVLSDLHLDNIKIMNAFKTVLAAYEDMDDADKPSLFILCGNFRSRPFLFDGEATRDYQDLFTNLANVLASYPTLIAHAQFLLVPGPTDPWSSNLLPRPALPESLVKSLIAKVPNITFGSNPCRVRYFSQEIVVFREDLMGRMMRNAVRLGGPRNDGDMANSRKALVQTIIDQAHLTPLPLNVRPVLWDYDHAMRLYPMPTTLILADKFDPYKLVYEGCLAFNPGSFMRQRFTWSTYHPHMPKPTDRMEERYVLKRLEVLRERSMWLMFRLDVHSELPPP